MILWVVLFALVVAISFVLAAQSMRDFTETPSIEGEFALFLIRNTAGLTPQLLDSLKNELIDTKTIVSFERLFKGGKSALVVFGPRSLILNHKTSLDLLELEDYTHVSSEHVSVWEVGIKKGIKITEKIFTSLAYFQESEQFWFQVILSAHFKPQITAVLLSADTQNRNTLTHKLQHLASEKLHKLPKAYSSAQLLGFYQQRSLKKENKNHVVAPEEVLNLISL